MALGGSAALTIFSVNWPCAARTWKFWSRSLSSGESSPSSPNSDRSRPRAAVCEKSGRGW